VVRLVSLLAAALLVALVGPAAAQPSSADPAVELETLGRELEEELAAGNCAVACAALESMKRASERLCEMDPGPACERARAKVEDAEERVRNACDCAVATTDEPGRTKLSEQEPDRMTEAQPAPMADPAGEAASAPPEEEARGGCAACAVAGPGDAGAGALLVLLALALGRRRLSRAPRHGERRRALRALRPRGAPR
jgi:MYXO-CTERM domain-containing protein